MRFIARAHAWPILVLLTATVGWPLLACPPSYVPDLHLWTGIREADLVVAAEIVDVEVNDIAVLAAQFTKSASRWLGNAGLPISLPSYVPSGALTLEIDETIKGTPRQRVTFQLKGIYTEHIGFSGYKAVYFLSRNGWAWELTRYPVLYRDRGELDDLRHVIRQALAITEPTDEIGGPMEWLVEAAVRPGTRSQVLNALMAHQPLPPSALRRLADGFVTQPLYDRSVPRMLLLLKDYPSTEVDRAARTGLELMESPSRDEVERLLRERMASYPAN